ncbi:MAG: peptidoglycan-binding protein [Rhodospirillaceae bacterium]|nr:peptidoglycan-binding protein [Rhodospirillaceae bacterium]MBT6117473.1 peptidoglycan-binding protein [Rhodospirillaceae bacterium]
MNGDTFDVTPWEKTDLFLALIEGNCQQNPEIQIVAIVHGLVQSLLPNRLKAPSEVKQVDLGEGRKVTHYVETLRRIQKALKDQGHYSGGIDGDYGPGTRAAMAAFQTKAGLDPTGLPDQLTLLRLLHPSGPGGG